VINAIHDAPGAVITTATRPDNISATLTARQKIGSAAVFDPNDSPKDSPPACVGPPSVAAKTH
jgi:type IV secretion system protein VirD4